MAEMWSFLGLIVAMGLIVVSDMDDYWSTDEVFSMPFFRTVMKRQRFCLILSFLHLCNNDNQPGRDHLDFDPIYKISTFIKKLSENFRRVFKPGKNIAVDEAMIAWRGPLAFRVFNPDKPDKFGIKVFELCDSATGYCCNFEFYSGKKTCSAQGATFDIVDRLTSPYYGCGRTLYVDNYYTSPDLFRHLHAEGTLACGTMRLNRKNGPPKRMIPKLKKTDKAPSSLTNGTLNLLRFFDKREVNVLTTAHNHDMVETGKNNLATGEAIVKLQAVVDYNKFMGAVDRSDQMVSYHTFKRRTLKWWKKAFFHMFSLGVLNAFLLQKVNAAIPLTHRIFRRELSKQLARLAPIFVNRASERLPIPDVGDSQLFRLTARHFLQAVKPKPGAKKQNPQRDCVVCSGPGNRKQTRYECSSCNVGLHIEPCFMIFHTQKDFKRAAKRALDE